MSVLDQLWPTLWQTKHNCIVIDLLIEKYQKRDRFINVFTAVASSSSIGAWAAWQALPFLWASIIAFSQVITAIKPYFTYPKYILELNTKVAKLQILVIELEFIFAKHDDVYEEEWIMLEEKYKIIKLQINEILAFSDSLPIEVDEDLKKRADNKLKAYLANTFNV